MYLLKKTASLFTSLLTFSIVFYSSIASAANLEIINGNLFDSRTGLTWQRLDAVVVTQLPLNPQLNGARVATGNEINSLLPITFGDTSTISNDSDIFTALSFFSSSFSSPIPNSPMSNCTNCFSAWSLGHIDPLVNPNVNYEQAFYSFSRVTVLGRFGRPTSLIQYSGASTIGSYDANSAWCRDCNGALFTVLSVPEPSTYLLFPLGMMVLIVNYRRNKTQ